MKEFFKNSWWKILCIILLIYVVIGGLLFDVPDMPVIRQTIRNIYFHVGMWFAMIFVMFVAMIYSILHLNSNRQDYDTKALSFVNTGLIFGVLGLITGMIWAKYTWGNFWVNDPKLNGAAIGVMVYLAYLVLRSSVEDYNKRSKLAAVYNVFAFVMFFIFIMIIPRLASSSIHPGVDGNPALATGDLDNSMRKVFYPAIIGWIFLSYWIGDIIFRIRKLSLKMDEMSLEKYN